MSLKVWLPLTGNLDNLGLSNLKFSILHTNTVVNGTPGKLSQYCFKTTASTWANGGLISDTTIDLGQQQSMFCWFKFTTLDSNSNLGGALMTQHRSGNYTGMGITIRYASATTGYLSVNTGNGSSRTYNTYYGTTLLQAETWYHGGYTYDGANIKIYVNGVCEKTQAYTGMSTPADYLGIGFWTLSGTSGYMNHYVLNGSINDARAYDHALSAKEVKEIAKGLTLHYKLDGNGLGGENLIKNSTGFYSNTNWSGAVTASTENGYPYLIATRTDTASTSRTFCTCQTQLSSLVSTWGAGAKFTISGYYKIPTTASITASYVANMFIRWTLPSGSSDTGFTVATTEPRGVWTYFEKTYQVPSAYTNGTVYFYLSAFPQGLSTIYWKNVKMELGPHATAWSPAKADTDYPTALGSSVQDCSGYRYNGITNNIVCTGDTPRYSAASTFNGTNSYMKCESNEWMTQSGDALTVNIWVKAASWPADLRWFSCTEGGGFTIYSSTTSGYYRWIVHAYTNSAHSSSGYLEDLTAIKVADLPTNQWVMITGVYTKSAISTYINGQLSHTKAVTSYGLHYNTAARLFLGCEANSASPYTPYFNGQMSDFRLYYTALSAEDILELYHTSGTIDKSGNVYAREVIEQ